LPSDARAAASSISADMSGRSRSAAVVNRITPYAPTISGRHGFRPGLGDSWPPSRYRARRPDCRYSALAVPTRTTLSFELISFAASMVTSLSRSGHPPAAVSTARG
jgi:hypothetical protein